MAVLPDVDRALVSGRWQRDVSARRQAFVGVTKADILAAVAAIDGWVDSNTSAFNTAIPQPARSNLTSQQKAELLLYVVQRRFEVS